MIGIMCAMEEEIKDIETSMEIKSTKIISGIRFREGVFYGKECVVALSGVGKVSAAVCAQTMILKYKPSCILNIGTAGGIASGVKTYDLVIGKNAIQHDYDISAFGDKKKGQLSGLNIREIPCSETLIKKAIEVSKELNICSHVGNILTGDQFVNDKNKVVEIRDEFNGIACEMECGSIGQVCYMNNIDFLALKIISDNAEKSANVEFEDFLIKYPQIASDIICKLIKEIQHTMLKV